MVQLLAYPSLSINSANTTMETATHIGLAVLITMTQFLALDLAVGPDNFTQILTPLKKMCMK